MTKHTPLEMVTGILNEHLRLRNRHYEEIYGINDFSLTVSNLKKIKHTLETHDELLEALEEAKKFIEIMPKGIGRGAASPVYIKILEAIAKGQDDG